MMQKAIKGLRSVHIKNVLRKEDDLFLSRQDHKFVVPKKHIRNILKFLKTDFSYIHFGNGFICKYHNIYFDTDDYKFFNLHRQGKYNRIKIRTREYKNGIQNKFLEFKKKVRGIKTEKKRIQLDANFSSPKLLNQSFVTENLKKYKLQAGDLKKETEIFYKRISLIAKDLQSRITIDFDICVCNKKSDLIKIMPEYFILEVKSKKYPKSISQFLRKEYKIREESFSKYCIALCLLEDKLKKNKWKTLLKKYFSKNFIK